MKLLSASNFSGCNIYAGTSVIRQEVDLGTFVGMMSCQAGPDFTKSFINRFQGLKTLTDAGAIPDEFVDRLNSAEGAPFVEVLFHAILAVEAAMAHTMLRLGDIDVAKIVPHPSAELAQLVWSYRVPEVSLRVATVGLIGLHESLPKELRWRESTGEDSFGKAYESLRKLANKQGSDNRRSILIRAAETRGIPWEIFSRRFMRFGQGKFQQRARGSATDGSSQVARKLAHDKHITNRLLSEIGLPVPLQKVVTNAEDAVAAAAEFGFPVVVKPSNLSEGKGVTADLREPDEVRVAFDQATRYGSRPIVESFVEGKDYRLLVVDGQLVAANNRIPPFVTGDSTKTIGELIDELNKHPLRDGLRWKQVYVDDELKRLLDRAGYNLDTVLETSDTIVLRSTGNVSTGGVPVDLTDQVHPDNREMAVLTARVVGLNVVGIDFRTIDIRRSHKEVGGGIIEVNYSPGILGHLWPAAGEPRDVGGAIIESMFPPGATGRVPVALVADAPGSDRVAGALDRILRSAGTTVALSTKDGAFVNGEPAVRNMSRGRNTTRSLLRDPRVEALIDTVSPRRVAGRGLLHEVCEVAVIMDPGKKGEVEEVQQGLEVVVRATRGKLAVAADSKAALELVRDVDPDRLVLVTRNAGRSAVRRHLEAGGQTVVTARDHGERVIVLVQGDRTILSIPFAGVAALAGNPLRRLIEACLFAVALAHGMGLSADQITSALRDDQSA